ncbi:MAG: GrpB family protein [Pseudomonadota bacterium]
MALDGIEIADYDPDWPRLFQAESEALAPVLNALPLVGLEHIGSTAVPGLAAKPIIDILAIVEDLEYARTNLPEPMAGIDYVFWADNPTQDRLFFVKGMPPHGERRTHHVHVCQPGPLVDRHILFRDYLRAHPTEAAAYAVLKRRLAAEHTADREGYTAAKNAFVERVVALAERWCTLRAKP